MSGEECVDGPTEDSIVCYLTRMNHSRHCTALRLSALALVAIALLGSQCGGDEDDPESRFVGTWTIRDTAAVFLPLGSYVQLSETGSLSWNRLFGTGMDAENERWGATQESLIVEYLVRCEHNTCLDYHREAWAYTFESELILHLGNDTAAAVYVK